MMKQQEQSVAVVIPLFRPTAELKKLLERLLCQTCSVHRIILLRTQSIGDSTDEILSGLKEEDREKILLKEIEPSAFNHGLTRNIGMSLAEEEFVIMMTQDAIPADRNLVKNLLAPFEDENVAVTYARQLPKKDCRTVERYVRSFNYPEEDLVKTKESFKTMGIKALFCSDVCAAYRRKEHERLGGFKETDFNEDMIFAYDAMMDGKKVYYAAKARVFHSHNYSYRQQLLRNRDIGRSQKQFSYIFASLPSEKEGIRLLKNGVEYLLKTGKWYYIPDLVISSGFKYIGYQWGKH